MFGLSKDRKLNVNGTLGGHFPLFKTDLSIFVKNYRTIEQNGNILCRKRDFHEIDFSHLFMTKTSLLKTLNFYDT